MAKCVKCGTRKGKRQCLAGNGLVCTQCCGETRSKESCGDCASYRDFSARKYLDLPRFSTEEMEVIDILQGHAYVIELAMCEWDYQVGETLKDETVLRVMELLLDKYHFGDSEVATADALLKEGFDRIDSEIVEQLEDVPHDVITKILGVIYFVAKRRKSIKRDYLEFLHDYTE